MGAVAGGSGAGVAVEVVLAFERGGEDVLVPERLAGAPVEADEPPGGAFLDRSGEENAVADDDRGGVTRAGDGDFPADVLRVAPLGGEVGFERRPVAARSAPGGPVFGAGGGACESERRDAEDAEIGTQRKERK